MAPHLLAITQWAGYILYLIAGLYCALAAYILFGGWRRRDGSSRIRLLWFLFLPTTLFVVFWFCGQWIWTVVLFLILGVDAAYEQGGRAISSVVALVVSAVLFVRLAMGRAGQRFRAICSLGAVALALLFCTMHVIEFSSRIWGWSARGAAENDFAKFRFENHPFIDPSAARRIVEEPISDPSRTETEAKRFVLYYGNSPIREVTVVRYGWWWWTIGSSLSAIPPRSLDWAVDNWDTERDEATKLLEDVIRNYPDSYASRWASTTLAELRETGRSSTPPWRSEVMRRRSENAASGRDAGTQD